METKKKLGTLALIYLLVLAIRLIFAFQADTFTGDESYFSLRQVEHISNTGLPLYDDSLSYGGRINILSPFFYYLLAFFSQFMSIELAAKLIPNIIANSIIFLTYFIALDISRNQKVALFTAVTSAFIPIFFTETVNSATPKALVFPLILTLIYCLMNIDRKKRYVNIFIAAIFILALTDISAYLVILSFLVYLLLIKLEKLKQMKSEIEIILFGVFLVIWSQFIIFKKAFLLYGPGVLLQNIPSIVIQDYFHELNIIEATNKIGIIPLIFGIYVIYKYSFKEKKRGIYLLLGFIINTAILLWLKLIPIDVGLILGGILLSLLFSQYLKLFLLFIQKSKLVKYENYFIGVIILLFIITSIIPSMYYTDQKIKESYSKEFIEAMQWLRDNTENSSTVLSSYKEGSVINYEAGRKNVVDSNFLTIENIGQRFEDVREIYTAKFETVAISNIEKYGIDYIMVTERAKKLFGIKELEYAGNERCFELVFENSKVKVYEPLCKIKR